MSFSELEFYHPSIYIISSVSPMRQCLTVVPYTGGTTRSTAGAHPRVVEHRITYTLCKALDSVIVLDYCIALLCITCPAVCLNLYTQWLLTRTRMLPPMAL